jgi:hypothetical protein
MVVCRKTIVVDWGLTRYIGKVLLPMIVLYGIGGAIVYACLPKLAAAEIVTGRMTRYSAESYRHNMEATLEENPQILSGTEKEIGEALLRMYNGPNETRKPRNMIAGTGILLEDSPGNITVEKTDKKVTIRVYDYAGRPMLIEKPIPAAKGQGRGGQGSQ